MVTSKKRRSNCKYLLSTTDFHITAFKKLDLISKMSPLIFLHRFLTTDLNLMMLKHLFLVVRVRLEFDN